MFGITEQNHGIIKIAKDLQGLGAQPLTKKMDTHTCAGF